MLTNLYGACMRKIVLLMLMATAMSISPAYAFDRARLLDAFFSIVLVRGYNQDGSMAYGSGIIVAPNKVVTNCHVLRQTREPWVSRGEDSYSITSIQADRWHDLCLLTMDQLPFKPVEIGNSNTLKKGQEIVSIGHSSGSPSPVTSVGNVKSLYPLDQGNIIRSSARFALGASGSGLFDNSGKLVGINTFKTIGRNAYFYALPVEWIQVLEKLPEEPIKHIEGKTFWEADEDSKPFFLRVATPEIQEDWLTLEGIAKQWIQAEPDNTEAWYELGFAQEHLDHLKDAEASYRKSISLNAINTDALFRIGILAAGRGDKQEMHRINLALRDIDQDIATEFSTAAGCGSEC
jgi:hypothetical protein